MKQLNSVLRLWPQKKTRNVPSLTSMVSIPINKYLGTSFIHITVKDIVILATTKANVNVAMTLQFLYSLVRA